MTSFSRVPGASVTVRPAMPIDGYKLELEMLYPTRISLPLSRVREPIQRQLETGANVPCYNTYRSVGATALIGAVNSDHLTPLLPPEAITEWFTNQGWDGRGLGGVARTLTTGWSSKLAKQ